MTIRSFAVIVSIAFIAASSVSTQAQDAATQPASAATAPADNNDDSGFDLGWLGLLGLAGLAALKGRRQDGSQTRTTNNR